MSLSLYKILLSARALFNLAVAGFILWIAYLEDKWRGLLLATISIAILILFIYWLSESLYSPYIPPRYWEVACWYILAPALTLAFYVVGYLIKPINFNVEVLKRNLVKQGKSKVSQWIFVLFGPLFIAYLVVFLIYLIPVMPTKYLADKFFQHDITLNKVRCEHSSKGSIQHTEFTYIDGVDYQRYVINFPHYVCRDYPNIEKIGGSLPFLIEGREWFFGKYIDAIEFPDRSGYLIN